ncbi:hypothetical protein T06_13447 [Trichinella sp. T6]|nr:hypothetical protein T06_13447 [Trichinella sp. T6]
MSNCFKRDVTKLQTIKLKIDRMRRKENPLGWALPQQSIKGLIVITTASKQISVYTNLLPSAITTIREKQFYSKISKQQRSSTLLSSQHLRLILLLSLFTTAGGTASGIESFQYTLWQYRLPIFGREQIVGQLASTVESR